MSKVLKKVREQAMQIYEKSIPGIANGKCKGPETEACMRNGKDWGG